MDRPTGGAGVGMRLFAGAFDYSGVLLQRSDNLCYYFTYLTAANIAFDTQSQCFTATASVTPATPSQPNQNGGSGGGGGPTVPNPNAALVPGMMYYCALLHLDGSCPMLIRVW